MWINIHDESLATITNKILAYNNLFLNFYSRDPTAVESRFESLFSTYQHSCSYLKRSRGMTLNRVLFSPPERRTPCQPFFFFFFFDDIFPRVSSNVSCVGPIHHNAYQHYLTPPRPLIISCHLRTDVSQSCFVCLEVALSSKSVAADQPRGNLKTKQPKYPSDRDRASP